MSLTIRPLHQDDIPAVAVVARQSYADAFGHSMSPEVLAADAKRNRSEDYFRATFHETIVLVAEDGGEIVGYAQTGKVKIANVTAAPEDRELSRLYVATSHHRRGIGRRLLENALAHPSMLTAPTVYLTVWDQNRKAQELYRSAGFEVVGTTVIEDYPVLTGRELVMARHQRL